jgi:hypothetical protein
LLGILIKELNLDVKPLLTLLAKGINRGDLIVYSTIEVDVTITNLRSRVKTQRIPFIVIDLKRYRIYLGLP